MRVRTSPALAIAPAEQPLTVDAAWAVAEYGGYVFGLLHRLGVAPPDVPDVAQEVFLAVYEQLASFEGRSSLTTWVCGISVRKAADYRRTLARHRRRTEALAAEPIPDACAADPSQQLDVTRRAESLCRALDQLTDKERSVFVLYELEELSMAEVAAALGCPRFTAYTRLHAARKRLRAALAAARALDGEV